MEFITGEIWELIDRIFELWENVGIKSQKVKRYKPLISANSKSSPKMKILPEDMTITHWRSMQGVKDENLVKTILSRVKSGELSMEEMSEKFLKFVIFTFFF